MDGWMDGYMCIDSFPKRERERERERERRLKRERETQDDYATVSLL
jgi:hypothetical protein